MHDVIPLPCARIHKKEKIKRLNNPPGNFVESFNKDWLDGIDLSRETDQEEILKNTPSEDVKDICWQQVNLVKRCRQRTD